MAAGANYDHPNYVVRQMVPLGAQAAGTSTSARRAFPVDMVIRRVHARVTATGTQTAWNAIVLNGTTSIGALAFGTTAAINGMQTSADCNSVLTAGTILGIATLLEATGVAEYLVECHLAPTATW